MPLQNPFKAGSLFVPVAKDSIVSHLAAGDPDAVPTEKLPVLKVRPVSYNSPLIVKRPVMRSSAKTRSQSREKQNNVPVMRAVPGTGLGAKTRHSTVPKMRTSALPKNGPNAKTVPQMRVRPGTGASPALGLGNGPKLRSGVGMRDGARLPLHVPMPKDQIASHLEGSSKHGGRVGSTSALWPRTVPRLRAGIGAKHSVVPLIRGGTTWTSNSRPVPILRNWNRPAIPKKESDDDDDDFDDDDDHDISPPVAYRSRLLVNRLSNNLKQWANIQGLSKNRKGGLFLDLS